MGIFDALTSAVSGLSAQAYALQNISGNIANSQTVGFKETNTSFQELVTAASTNAQTSGSVIASSVATNSVQGAIQSESVSTYMAVNGDGYFIVAQPTSVAGNQPVFNGVSLYTRRGDFQENSQGFLVNGAGYYLMGIPIDRSGGNPVGSVPQVLQFGNNEIPAQVTTQIQYQANLPTFPAYRRQHERSGFGADWLAEPAWHLLAINHATAMVRRGFGTGSRDQGRCEFTDSTGRARPWSRHRCVARRPARSG